MCLECCGATFKVVAAELANHDRTGRRMPTSPCCSRTGACSRRRPTSPCCSRTGACSSCRCRRRRPRHCCSRAGASSGCSRCRCRAWLGAAARRVGWACCSSSCRGCSSCRTGLRVAGRCFGCCHNRRPLRQGWPICAAFSSSSRCPAPTRRCGNAFRRSLPCHGRQRF